MANRTIQEIVDAFVKELSEVIREQARDEALDCVKAGLGMKASFGNKPMKSKKEPEKRKRNYTRRPCPVEGCDRMGVPRFHQLCREHDRELSIEESDALRARAERPGGKWYKLGIGKYFAADEKKRKKAG